MRTIAIVVIAAFVATGCSSGYFPRSPGRVAVTMRGGMVTYVRDGQVHSHGMFGGGLSDAVRGVPAAEQAADEYRSRMKTGFLVATLGLVCSGVGLTLAVAQAAEEDPYDGESHVPTAMWVGLGCLVASMGGLGYLITAEPYRWDAINIFNDSAVPVPGPTVPVGPPGGFGFAKKQKMSLGMRD